ncbi:MAG TPA: FAD-dependent monooxygenase [Micromonosporaceae bacterium]|jgi:2-polyprenyl-6-methoxyphenol hydroxylase-like FAD-dependent oxidoreductase
MRVGIVGGSIAGCATAALLHRAGHDVTVLERSESDLVSRGAGILVPEPAWQGMTAHGLIDETVPACRTDSSRLVTRAPESGQVRWLGDVELGMRLFNWAHLYQGLRRQVPDDLYRNDAAVERIEPMAHGVRLHLADGSPLDVDLVVCADGYRSLGRSHIDPDAALAYRGMVLWRGLMPEHDIGSEVVRPVYPGGHGIAYYIPGPGGSIEPGERLLMWGYYLQVPQSDLAALLVDNEDRQQSRSVPFGKVHPQVRSSLESRLAGLLPAPLFDLVRHSANTAIQAVYSFVPSSYARDRVCLVGDAGAVLPPFAGGGVARALSNAASLTAALAGDASLQPWSDAQLEISAQGIRNAELIEQVSIFGMPDLSAMPTAATNGWMSAIYSGLPVTLPSA